uniref:Pecanex-like protein n=1 Tax=Macrostomum lignano TaxID=282301 RepID=A0A1I8GVL5_9PLAT
ASGLSSDLRPPSETRDEDLAPVTHQASGLSSDLRPPSETKDEDLAPVAHHVGGVEQGLNPPSGSADTQDELSALSLELEPAHENRTDALGAMFHKQSESSPETGGQTQSHEEELTTEPVKHEYTAMSPHSAEHREQALKAKQLQRIDNSLNSDRPENSSPSSEVSESKHAKHPSEQRGGAATPPVMANFACHVERGNSCASSVRSRSDTDEAGADTAATNSPRISKFSCRVYRNGELVEANDISEAPPADGAAARSSVCSSASTAEEREEWDEFNGRTVSVTRISQPMPECPQSWSSTRRERRPRRSHPVCQVGVTDGNQVNVAWLPSLRRGHGGQQVVKDAELDVVRQTLKAPFLSSVGLEMSDRGCDVVVKQTYPTVSAGIRACSGADHPSV